MEKTYVIGHLSPDTDTIVSAMSLSALLNMRDHTNHYTAAMTGPANSETTYIFNRFKVDLPEVLDNAKDKILFLVDHNETSQMVKNAQNILGVVDHHKMKFEYPTPIEITTKPWGSTNTVIFDMFRKYQIEIPLTLKPLMLAAILSDTVILKSPTTTPFDMQVVEELSQELDINFEELGMEIFKAKAQIIDKTGAEILKNDFKDFEFSGQKVGIGQVETPDLKDAEAKIPEIIAEMNKIKPGYHTLILMLTDIIQEGTKLLVVSDDINKIAQIFNTTMSNSLSEFIPGMMSRKKQVASALAEKF